MDQKQLTLSCWWHEEFLIEKKRNVLKEFIPESEKHFSDNFEVPKGDKGRTKNKRYTFYIHRQNKDINLELTRSSIDLTYLGDEPDMGSLLDTFNFIFEKVIKFHQDNSLDFDHYHFFIESEYKVYSTDIIGLFKDKLGVTFKKSFTSKKLKPTSSNVQYEIKGDQTAILSLIMKNWETRNRFEYKLKVDAGKVTPDITSMKVASKETMENYLILKDEILNHANIT